MSWPPPPYPPRDTCVVRFRSGRTETFVGDVYAPLRAAFDARATTFTVNAYQEAYTIVLASVESIEGPPLPFPESTSAPEAL